MTPKLVFAYPGDLNLKTGGYGYDRKLISGLRELGWDIEQMALGDGFPAPAPTVKAGAEHQLSGLPDGTLVIIDGLAFGVLDDWAAREAQRLNIIALVHHPLALETGLNSSQQTELRDSEREALSYVRAVIVTSPVTARELITNFGVEESDVTIALPGTEAAPVSACNGNPPLVLSIGSLVPRKAHHILVDALKQLEDLAWKAIIVGSKTLHPQTAEAVEQQVATLGLGDRIRFTGEHEDPRALLAQADIFALASRYEGYGMVFAEALSQGVPIIACHAGAVPDVVPEGAGFLVPVDDTDAFARALRVLLSDKALHKDMAHAAKLAGEELPGWDVTAKIISTLLEKYL